MATWRFEKADDKTCTRCRSTYEVKYHQVPVKDIDSYNCALLVDSRVLAGEKVESMRAARELLANRREARSNSGR
jgi:hypothetical protein